MDETPLIFTSKGNVPLDSVQQSVEWTITDDYIVFAEQYTDATGEVVKRSAHVYSRKGVSDLGAAGTLGG
jgi:hypothetical protein